MRVHRRLPALSSFLGQSPAQEIRWPSVGNRPMSTPISAAMTSALPSRWGCRHPHPSQSRTCRFPASGSSRESFARVGVKAMDDPRRGKRMALENRVEAGPRERASSTMPSRQPFLPQHHDLAGKPSYASRVAGYAVVGIVASQHLGQMGMLIAQGSMPIVSAPIAYRRQSPRVPAFGRHLPHPVHPLLRLGPDMGEAEEVERGAVRIRMADAPRPMKAKVDEVRLARVEREPVPRKPLSQHVRDPLGASRVSNAITLSSA